MNPALNFRDIEPSLSVDITSASAAAELVIDNHYMHRRPPISYAFGLYHSCFIRGIVTYGIPASRHLQKGVCPSNPDLVIELNRIWVGDELPRNTASWFVSRTLALLPGGLLIVSYADTSVNHTGYLYRALNWHYAGWTDMERKTPRPEYTMKGKHSREAYRGGERSDKLVFERRKTKHRYWTASGNRRERQQASKLCHWPHLDWHVLKHQ